MKDYDLWLVHEYFSVYFCFHAEDEDEVIRQVTMRLQEEGLPDWLYDDAQEIKIEEVGVFAV